MNNNCYGDLFVIGRSLYLRCFLDSTMIKIKDIPEICPHCKRPLNADIQGKVKIRKIKQFWNPKFEKWEDMPEDPEKQLLREAFQELYKQYEDCEELYPANSALYFSINKILESKGIDKLEE